MIPAMQFREGCLQGFAWRDRAPQASACCGCEKMAVSCPARNIRTPIVFNAMCAQAFKDSDASPPASSNRLLPMAFRPAAVFVHFLIGMAGASPQVINAEFDSAPQAFDHRLSVGNFRQRALRLSQRFEEAEEQLLRLKAQSSAAPKPATSLLSLQPVDAERVANGIAATEPMLAPNGWTINVSEENRGSKVVARTG